MSETTSRVSYRTFDAVDTVVGLLHPLLSAFLTRLCSRIRARVQVSGGPRYTNAHAGQSSPVPIVSASARAEAYVHPGFPLLAVLAELRSFDRSAFTPVIPIAPNLSAESTGAPHR